MGRFRTGALDPQQDFTQLLVSWRRGEKSALDALTAVLYEELRRLAGRLLAAERPEHTLQPTALVHEAYMRLVDQNAVDCHDRAHFLGVAAIMMRRILINHAKAHKALKREAFAGAVSLDDAVEPSAANPTVDLLALDQLLDRLSVLDPQQGRVVELRYFGGLSIEETAEVMGISAATVKRDWGTARLWFVRQMSRPGPAQECESGEG
ncbi:MAG TPA: sigma-70 family RNA polymerase sigma factor [Bryobacteraceae bacterium]|nr:sigma-70 family RNA polymerase sigma factor [Bryobacteraceae bacterium]